MFCTETMVGDVNCVHVAGSAARAAVNGAVTNAASSTAVSAFASAAMRRMRSSLASAREVADACLASLSPQPCHCAEFIADYNDSYNVMSGGGGWNKHSGPYQMANGNIWVSDAKDHDSSCARAISDDVQPLKDLPLIHI